MKSLQPKVLHIITRLDPGGSATNTITSVNNLRKYGFDTSIAFGVTLDKSGHIESSLSNNNIKWYKLRYLVRNPSPVKDLKAIAEISKILKDEHIDLIHTHSSKAGVLGRIAARLNGVPSVHTPHGHVFYGYFGSLLTKLFIFIERWMAKYTRCIISLTDIETTESLKNGIGTKDQYVTIHSGIKLSSFQKIPEKEGFLFRKKFNIPVNSFLFVSIGRLVHIKGFDILIKGFFNANFKEKHVFMAIIGGGDQEQYLKNMVEILGLSEKIIFTGALDNILPPLSAGNAFVLTPRNEGMGRVFIEAMSAGIPVIGSAVGGIPSIIHDNKTGILIHNENPENVASSLEKCVMNYKFYCKLCMDAFKFVYPEYDEKTMIENIAEVYRGILDLNKSESRINQ